MEPTAMETASMKAAAVEAAGMEPTAVESTTSVEAAASVKPTVPTMRTGVGEAWLAQRRSEQQSSCGSSQKPAHFGLNSFFT
jgi:hypothetical protein